MNYCYQLLVYQSMHYTEHNGEAEGKSEQKKKGRAVRLREPTHQTKRCASWGDLRRPPLRHLRIAPHPPSVCHHHLRQKMHAQF